MLKIHELTNDAGQLEGVYLRVVDGQTLEIVDGAGASPLPLLALEKVLVRFGAPFDGEARITIVAELELRPGQCLRHVRHLAGYDVVARDYLVLDSGTGEPLCAPGATVAGALQHLARVSSAARC